MQDAAPGSAVVLAVNGAQMSQMVGQHRQNIIRLCEEFGLKSLKITPKALDKGKIEIVSVEKPGKV